MVKDQHYLVLNVLYSYFTLHSVDFYPHDRHDDSVLAGYIIIISMSVTSWNSSKTLTETGFWHKTCIQLPPLLFKGILVILNAELVHFHLNLVPITELS